MGSEKQDFGQPRAKLRTCASCEWIYRVKTKDLGCPRCGFASYGARFAYGDKAYKYEKTQRPWFERKMAAYMMDLQLTIGRGPIPACGNTGAFGQQRDRCEYDDDDKCIHCGEEIPF